MLPGFNPLNLAGQVVEVLGGGGGHDTEEGGPNEGSIYKSPREDEHILQLFVWDNLSPQSQLIAHPFQQLAEALIAKCPRGRQRTRALGKLLEARNAVIMSLLPGLEQ